MSWWGWERKYEDEYTLASRVGRIVGRKMVKENTRIVKFRVRPDNELTNWFTSPFLSYRSAHGGWNVTSSRDCFRRELHNAWAREQPESDALYEERDTRLLLIIRSKYVIMFLNVMGIPDETWRLIYKIGAEIRDLEYGELELKWSEEEACRYSG